jgi:hypothetical protein
MSYVDIGEIIFITISFVGAMGGFFYALRNGKI